MVNPKEAVDKLERDVGLPLGTDERFSGYGVMGVPFSSGHVLCLRRFPVTSLGQGYTSVWHRNPEGRWTFIQDVTPQRACSRYFGSAVARSLMREIRIVWSDSHDFTVVVPGDYSIHWQVSLSETLVTRIANSLGALMPGFLWRQTSFLKLLGGIGSLAFGAGHLSLTGQVPNGQRFMANPKYMWAISSSRATVCGQDLGKVDPLPAQAKIGDFWIPQRGRFFIGNAFLEPFDPARHLSTLSQEPGPQ